MTVENNIIYAQQQMDDVIYLESMVEGVPVSFPDVEMILQNKRVSGLSEKNHIVVKNLQTAWDFILDTLDVPIDLPYIQQLDYFIGKDVIPDAGVLRMNDVEMGGTTWIPEIPQHDKVAQELADIQNSSDSKLDQAIFMLLYLMRAQLFPDGNKRVAQLAANQMLIKNGLGLIAIPVERREEFFKMLIDYYESNEDSVIQKFLYNYCVMLPKEN